MSGFKYSDDDLNINKILKMNQDISRILSNDYRYNPLRQEADKNILSSFELLSSCGKNKEIEELSAKIANTNYDTKLEHRPKLLTYDELVKQACLYEPGQVVLEDIMTEKEINAAFSELNDINKQFSRKTSIVNKTDLSFLMVATALQVTKSLVFPYIAEKFDYGKSFNQADRMNHNDKSIEQAHKEANDAFRDKHKEKHGTGHWINILYQTVPYDITRGSRALGINMEGKYHRIHTLGHDPILGWLFGTANILTDCITFNNFQTNRISRVDALTGKSKMIITPEQVFMGKMFSECYDEVKADYLNLPAAIFAQAQHLKSDKYTKLGLPVPILSSINENFASKLYKENYDALCFARDAKIVGASFVVSKLFDMIISLVHGMFMKADIDKNLYEVKTRKILLISNAIATSSSIINASITKNPKNLDIGGLLNTVTHLFSDIRFIARIKKEFIENEISNRVYKEILEIDEIYNTI